MPAGTVVNYIIGGAGLVISAISTGAALWQVYIKRKERQEAAPTQKEQEEETAAPTQKEQEEERAADDRAMAAASGFDGTLQTLEDINRWATTFNLTLRPLSTSTNRTGR